MVEWKEKFEFLISRIMTLPTPLYLNVYRRNDISIYEIGIWLRFIALLSVISAS